MLKVLCDTCLYSPVPEADGSHVAAEALLQLDGEDITEGNVEIYRDSLRKGELSCFECGGDLVAVDKSDIQKFLEVHATAHRQLLARIVELESKVEDPNL